MSDQPICFVISPIGEENGAVRKRSDMLLQYVIEPAAAACGYKTLRADKISESGNITTQVINHLIDDPMVVADLTGANANVFYELAVRHAAHKPFVQIIQQGERVPFDVSGLRTIPLDLDIASALEAKTEIEKQMRAAAEDPSKVESPISVAINFDKLNRSDDPAKRELANILQGIAEIRALIEKRLPQAQAQIRQVPYPADIEDVWLQHLGLGAAVRGPVTIGQMMRDIDEKNAARLEAMKNITKIMQTTNANTTTDADGNLVREEEE